MSGVAPTLSGATRLYVIVGDPIAQVRSPAGLTAACAAGGGITATGTDMYRQQQSIMVDFLLGG